MKKIFITILISLFYILAANAQQEPFYMGLNITCGTNENWYVNGTDTIKLYWSSVDDNFYIVGDTIFYDQIDVGLIRISEATITGATSNLTFTSDTTTFTGNIVASVTGSQDLGSDAISWDSLYVDNAVITNELVLEIDSGDSYKFTDVVGSTNILGLQALESGANCALHFFTKDGDGTDNASFVLYGMGTSEDRTNIESVNLLYRSSSTQFELFTNQTGSGTTRPLILYTKGNTDQFKLNTDGSNSMSGDLTVTGDQTLYAYMSFDDSSYVLPITQNVFSIITNPTNTLFTTGITRGITVTGDSVQIVTAGNYDLTYTMSWSGGNLSDNHAHFFVNGVQIQNTGFRRDMTTTNIGDATMVYQGAFSANDWISLRIQDTNSSNDLTLKSGSFKIFKL
jgi:hypothetical protein